MNIFRKLSKFAHINLLLAAFLMSAHGCDGRPGDTGEENVSKATASRRVIGVSQCNLGEPWRVQMNADIQREASQYEDLELIFKDAQNDALRQRAHVEEFIDSGVDLIIVSPKEAQPLAAPIASAYRSGIPVIVLDRAVPGEDFTCFIGADNVEIGRAAGKWIAEHTKPGSRIVELKGLMTSTPAQDRHKGFLEGLGVRGTVIFEADVKWLEPEARKEMDSALARFDQIDLVFGHNDPAAHGAYLAAKSVGREKQMQFVGIDGLPQEGAAYVRQGILDATFEYPTGGDVAIDTARKIFAGELVPKKITLPSHSISRESAGTVGNSIEPAAAGEVGN